jgi:hypothetical protein
MSNKGTEVRPFSFHATDEQLEDLRRRILAARLPEKEPVSDFSQGVPLATVQKLAHYWATEYDWRTVEARLNSVPNFITEIDGLDIHFIHVRSKHENALPLIVSHGWPGSIVEQLKLIEPLTNPTAHGGTEADAFHVIIPSMPGYGFSGKPTSTGWGPERIARAWDTLMKRLGYTRSSCGATSSMPSSRPTAKFRAGTAWVYPAKAHRFPSPASAMRPSALVSCRCPPTLAQLPLPRSDKSTS